jgi:hypothetical protein
MGNNTVNAHQGDLAAFGMRIVQVHFFGRQIMFEKTMVRGLVAVALVLLVSVVASGQATNLVVNGSFENPVIPSGGNPFQYGPPSTDWNYSGAGISNNTSNWGFQTTGAIPDGNQFCFLQGNGAYVSENVSFPVAGTYQLSYYAGGRYDNGGQPPVNQDNYGGDTTYGITLNSAVLATGITRTNYGMTQQTRYFSAPAGTQTLTLQVTGVNGGTATDQTAEFDAISITPVSSGCLIYTNPGTGSVTVPTGYKWTNVTVQCWGGGGGGGSAAPDGGGGGGGAYATNTYASISAGTYAYQVGYGGTSGNGGQNTYTSFGGAADVNAGGGGGGQNGNPITAYGGAGGLVLSGQGYSGGDGGYGGGIIGSYDYPYGVGGGGGGSAFPTGPDGQPTNNGGGGGFDSNGAVAGLGGAGYGAGGNAGGDHYGGGEITPLPQMGYAPGGGGGGAGGASSNIGASGAPGEIIITYTAEAVPEPSTLALLAAGAIGLAAYGWRQRKRSLSLSSQDEPTSQDDGPAIGLLSMRVSVRNLIKNISCAVLVGIVMVVAPSFVQADTMSYTSSTSDLLSAPQQGQQTTMTFPQFDLSLGSLMSLTLGLSGNGGWGASVEFDAPPGPGASGWTSSGELSMGGSVALDDAEGLLAGPSVGFGAGPFDFTIIGDGGDYNAGGSWSGLGDTIYTDPRVLSEFTGTGMVSLAAEGGAVPSCSGFDIVMTEYACTANLTASVTYTYNAVPEPATLTLFGAAVLGLGLVYLRGQKQNRSLSLSSVEDEPASQDNGPAILAMPSRWAEATRRVA